jgi:hypothetical protein
MGMDVAVKNVKIYNRINCCSERLSNARVTLWNSGNVIESRQLGDTTGRAEIDVPFGPLTRRVRIDLDRRVYLHVREVQVFDYNNVNVALRKDATQSTNSHNGAYPASNAVDGSLDTISHTEMNIGQYGTLSLHVFPNASCLITLPLTQLYSIFYTKTPGGRSTWALMWQ